MQPSAPQPPALPSLVQVQSIVKQLHAQVMYGWERGAPWTSWQASGAVHQLESLPTEGPQGKVWRFTKILLTTGLEEVIARAATNERVVGLYFT